MAEGMGVPRYELAHRGANREFGFEVSDIVARPDDVALEARQFATRRRDLERHGIEHHREDEHEQDQADPLELAGRHQHDIASFIELSGPEFPGQAGAAVRTALRSVAERARGLRASSSLPGRT